MIENRTVLLFDDEPQIRRVLRTSLASKGAQVLDVSSGEEAIEVLRRQTVDLILLDLGMPGAFHLFFAPQLMVVLSIVSDTELRRRLVSGFILGRTGCDRGHSCGRLDANSTEGMELAWALRPHFAADAEVGDALDAIIARGQARFGAVDRQRLEQLARQAAVRVALANFSA